MGRIAVVETWITGFGGVEVAIEGGDFDADFGDEVASQVVREGGWVFGRGGWEQVSVEDMGDWCRAPHLDVVCCCAQAAGVSQKR